MVFPGIDVPVTVTGEPLTADRLAGDVTVRLVCPCWCATYRLKVSAGCSSGLFAAISWRRRTYTPADHVKGAAEPAGCPFWKPIEAVVGSVPKGEAARLGNSQSCSG